jgi:hypothetical protein
MNIAGFGNLFACYRSSVVICICKLFKTTFLSNPHPPLCYRNNLFIIDLTYLLSKTAAYREHTRELECRLNLLRL